MRDGGAAEAKEAMREFEPFVRKDKEPELRLVGTEARAAK